MKKIFTICLALALGTSAVFAQQENKATINATVQASKQEGDQLVVELELDGSPLNLSAPEYVVVTPLVTDGTHEVVLDDILWSGRNHAKVYNRNVALGVQDPAEYYAVRKAAGNSDKTVAYRRTVPYQKWMDNARVMLREKWYACNEGMNQLALADLGAVVPTAVVPVVIPDPIYYYMEPEREPRKIRTELSDIYLNFPVNLVVIYPEYMNNTAELAKAEEMVRRLNNDKNLQIEDILIEGYASPEGSVPSNFRLSEGRAAALKNYLLPRIENSDRLPFRYKSGGEDWDGPIALLEQASFPGRDELLVAMRTSDRSDASEMALRNIGGGAPYRTMLKDIYPKVRRVACTITYSVREFTVEEAKEILKTNPELLSAYELYQVACSYPEGSAEALQALALAAQLYPDNDTALINAATAALAVGEPARAAHLLGSVTAKNAAYNHAYGLLMLRQGNLAEAEQAFNRALNAGVEPARHNLSVIQLKRDQDEK